MHRKTLLGGLLAASLMGFGAAAHAQFSAIVAVAPPAPHYEVMPAPRAGYVWSPGYWDLRGSHFVWVGGHWVAERPGYVYVEPRWEQRGGHWVLVGNSWERRGPYGDRDGDGIANRYDRDRDGDGIRNRRDDRPNRADSRSVNPWGDRDRDGIANEHDRDIDGDGVRNARDDFPNNPRRS